MVRDPRCAGMGRLIVALMLSVDDFHEGSSDLPTWAADRGSIYYTARVGAAIELMRVSLDGKIEQLSHSSAGVQHYHPACSRDGNQLLFGAMRSGTRQLYVSSSDGSGARPISARKPGHAAMHGHWQP